ncbi:MAG: hypothetical protein LBE67_07850, partial [Kocuria palustris]|nr:hypothetical protein [Kocuria palustris]
MKGEGHGAIKTAMNTFLDLSRSQFSISEEYIDALNIAYKAICDLYVDIPPYYALQMMLSQLEEVQELNSFVVKDNELNAIDKTVQTITIADFYRYSIAILDYIKSSKADSIALSAIRNQKSGSSNASSNASTSNNLNNSQKRRTNEPPKGVS